MNKPFSFHVLLDYQHHGFREKLPKHQILCSSGGSTAFLLSGLETMFYFHFFSWNMISLNVSEDNTGCILTELGEIFASVRFYLLPKGKSFQLFLLLRVGQHHSPFNLFLEHIGMFSWSSSCHLTDHGSNNSLISKFLFMLSCCFYYYSL